MSKTSKRGRPAKKTTATIPKKRGRPAKVASTEITIPKKRGRTAKKAVPSIAKRGRPAGRAIIEAPIRKKASFKDVKDIGKLPIVYDIPIPANTRRSVSDILDFDKMKVGGSIYVEQMSQNAAQAAARGWANKMLEAKRVAALPKFIARPERAGFRIWRVK